MGFDRPPEAGPNDLVIALRPDDPGALGRAGGADAALGPRRTLGGAPTVRRRRARSARRFGRAPTRSR